MCNKHLTVQICAQLIQVETHLKHENSWRKPHTEEAREQRRLAKTKPNSQPCKTTVPTAGRLRITAADIRP